MGAASNGGEKHRQSDEAAASQESKAPPSAGALTTATDQSGRDHGAGPAGEHDPPKDWFGISPEALTGRSTFVLTMATVILGIATAILAYFTCLLVLDGKKNLRHAQIGTRIAGRTLKHARDSSERQLRAYVFMTKGGVGIENNCFRARLTITNTGQTPAYDVEFIAALRFTDRPDLVAYGAEDAPKQRLALGPHSHANFLLFLNPFEVDPVGDEGARKLYIVGEITYRDSFNEARYTRLRLEVQGDVTVNKGTLRPCAEGNEAN